jgi:hypothetical protein
MPPKPIPFPTDRKAHARQLVGELTKATEGAARRRAETDVLVEGALQGVYVQFEGPPGVPLKLESLEDKRAGITLVAVTERKDDGEPEAKPVQQAPVFVPDGAIKKFTQKFEAYEKTAETGNPKNKDMVDRIARLRLATLRALWTDVETLFPTDNEAIWWEVWLRRRDGLELERFMEPTWLASRYSAISRTSWLPRIPFNCVIG